VRCRCLHRVNTVIKVERFKEVERFIKAGRFKKVERFIKAVRFIKAGWFIKVPRFKHGSGGHPLAWSFLIGSLAHHSSLPS
jgi:hypothetical protein